MSAAKQVLNDAIQSELGISTPYVDPLFVMVAEIVAAKESVKTGCGKCWACKTRHSHGCSYYGNSSDHQAANALAN